MTASAAPVWQLLMHFTGAANFGNCECVLSGNLIKLALHGDYFGGLVRPELSVVGGKGERVLHNAGVVVEARW